MRGFSLSTSFLVFSLTGEIDRRRQVVRKFSTCRAQRREKNMVTDFDQERSRRNENKTSRLGQRRSVEGFYFLG